MARKRHGNANTDANANISPNANVKQEVIEVESGEGSPVPKRPPTASEMLDVRSTAMSFQRSGARMFSIPLDRERITNAPSS